MINIATETTYNIEELLLSISKASYISIDTEFTKTNHYTSQLSLLQLKINNLIYLIDAHEDKQKKQLGRIINAIFQSKALKILHSCINDLEALSPWITNQNFSNIIDTQLLLNQAGFGKQVGYKNAVQTLLKKEMPESPNWQVWSHRPLGQNALKYAAYDVEYLRDLYLILKQKINVNSYWYVRKKSEDQAKKGFLHDYIEKDTIKIIGTYFSNHQEDANMCNIVKHSVMLRDAKAKRQNLIPSKFKSNKDLAQEISVKNSTPLCQQKRPRKK